MRRSGSRPHRSSSDSTRSGSRGSSSWRGDVDADRGRRRSHLESHRRASSHAETNTCWPISSMSPVSSANGMNESGRERAAFGMVPADERFERGDRARCAARRSAGSARRARRVRRRRADALRSRVASTAARCISCANTRHSSCRRPWRCTSRDRRCGASRRSRRPWSRRRCRCSRSPRSATRRATPVPATSAMMRSATVVASFGVAQLVHQHGELVAAEPGGGVARAQAAREPVAHDHEQRVAGGVAEAVVDGLEVVEVDEQHRELAAVALEPGRGVVDAVAEQRLVGEPGQRVVERLVRELVLEPAMLGDVAEAPHAPDDLAVDALREGVALEDAPVLELERVVALRLRARRRAPGPWRRMPPDRRAVRARTRAPGCRRASSALSGGRRHISAKRLLKLVMRPSPSTTRIPSAVDSSVAASTEFAARRSDSTATRSLMSWPVTTSPTTVGSSSRFVNVSANGTVAPAAWRRRTSTVTGAGARSVSGICTSRITASTTGRSRSSASVGERPVLQPLLVEAEDAGQPARRRLDDAVSGDQHRDRRRVLHERAEPLRSRRRRPPSGGARSGRAR